MRRRRDVLIDRAERRDLEHYHRDLRDFLEAIIDRCRRSADPRGELSRLAQLHQGFRRKGISRAVREAVRRLELADATKKWGEAMIGVMNNTKWDEVRFSMYALGRERPQFRLKHLKEDEPWPWDGEWYYHFAGRSYQAGRGYETIEWCELRTTSTEQRETVRGLLREIHVPGVETAEGFRLFGWVEEGAQVEYIS